MDKLNARNRDRSASDDSRNILPKPAGQSILVVDDEENFLILLDWFLTQRGYVVSTASNADQALGLLESRSFNLALLDIKLGATDGVVLLEQMTRRVPGLKVIMMTAYPTVASIKQAFDKGAVRYLTKPVDLHHLAEAIEVLF